MSSAISITTPDSKIILHVVGGTELKNILEQSCFRIRLQKYKRIMIERFLKTNTKAAFSTLFQRLCCLGGLV